MLWEQQRNEIPFNGGRGNWEKVMEMISFEPKLKGWTGIQ